MSTLTYTGTLKTTTCWCGIQHAVPIELYEYMLRQQADGVKQVGIYCPVGHSWTFAGKSEVDRKQEEIERLQRVAQSRLESLEMVRKQRDAAKRSAAAQKGQATKARKRAAASLCPVEGCHRSFVQIRRHLTAKHPDYVAPGA